MVLIDSHAHLNHEQFVSDWKDALQRAKAVGVTAVVNIGYDLPSSERAIEQCQSVSDDFGLFAVIGVHPHQAKEWNEEAAERLRLLAKHPCVVAIGEIGLDFHYTFSAPEAQERAFEEQLELAWQLGLPVVLHIREAYPQALEIVRRFGKPVRGVAHCFTGTWEDAKVWIEAGFYIGITGIVTFGRKADAMREVAAKVPLERLLIETDAPYLAPHPHRGKRNEPAYLPQIATAIAELRSISVDRVSQITLENARELFRLPLWSARR